MATIHLSSLPDVCARGVASFLWLDHGDLAPIGLEPRRIYIADRDATTLEKLAMTSRWAASTYLKFQKRICLYVPRDPFKRRDPDPYYWWADRIGCNSHKSGAEEEMSEDRLAERARHLIPSILARRPGLRTIRIIDDVGGLPCPCRFSSHSFALMTVIVMLLTMTGMFGGAGGGYQERSLQAGGRISLFV